MLEHPASVSRPARTSTRTRARRLAAIVLLLAVAGPAAESAPDLTLVELLGLSADEKRARGLDAAAVEAMQASVDRADATWPLRAYLIGEVRRIRGDGASAADWFRAVARAPVEGDAASKRWPSAITGLAYWRWLQGLAPDSPDAREAFDASRQILEHRVLRRLWGFGLFPSLPQLREDLYRRVLALAVGLGETKRASELLMRYLRIATTAELTPVANALLEKLYESGKASPDRIALIRAAGLIDLYRFEEANRQLRRAREGGDPEVRERSFLLEAKLQRGRGDAADDVLYTLNQLLRRQPDPAIEQEALDMRGIIYKLKGDRRLARRDFERIVKDFPNGDLADDALIELARDYQMANELDRALSYFDRVIGFKGPNDWRSTARVQAAFTRYIRWGRSKLDAEVEAAISLLSQVREQNRANTLNALSVYWLGRIAAERGEVDRARELFRSLVEVYPFEYYGIRARMRLAALGDRAASRAVSGAALPGGTAARELGDAFASSRLLTVVSGDRPAKRRFVAAIESGLYAAALDAERALRAAVPGTRLEDIELEALDRGRWLARIGMLAALRLDAVSAKESRSTPENLLRVAGLLMSGARDVPVGMGLVVGSGLAVTRHPAYLKTAYPSIYSKSLSAAVRKPGNASVLYAIARRESLFFPSAVSSRSAMGLFQVTPKRFESLDRRYDLVGDRSFSGYAEILLDPSENIRIGAIHFERVILPRYDEDLTLSLMAHNAGEEVVDDWIRSWDALGVRRDVELVIETGRATETRNFVRRVLADVAIARSAGLPGR